MPSEIRNRANEAANTAKANANDVVNSAEAKANESPIIRKAEDIVHKSSTLLQGQIPDSDVAMGHPIHPSTVHFPIAVSPARPLASDDPITKLTSSSLRPHSDYRPSLYSLFRSTLLLSYPHSPLYLLYHTTLQQPESSLRPLQSSQV